MNGCQNMSKERSRYVSAASHDDSPDDPPEMHFSGNENVDDVADLDAEDDAADNTRNGG